MEIKNTIDYINYSKTIFLFFVLLNYVKQNGDWCKGGVGIINLPYNNRTRR